MFYFSSKKDSYIIRRTLETVDNVVPASNSIMAKNLFRLSGYFANNYYKDITRKQLLKIGQTLETSPQNHANCLQLSLWFELPFYEVAVVGSECANIAKDLRSRYLPNTILAISNKPSKMPLFEQRYVKEVTQIYVCQQGTCQLPVQTIDEAITIITRNYS